MTETELFEKCDNLSEDELNTKTDKNVYVKNDAVSTVIKRYRAEKNRRKKNRCIYKKNDDSTIWNSRVSRTQSQTKNRKHIRKRKSFIKLILISVSITKKKYKLTKMGVTTYYLELMLI